MKLDEIRAIVERHIKTGERHENYNVFCDMADLASKYVTGDNQEVLIRDVRKNEDDEQKNLRVEVSIPKTPEAIAPITTVINRVYDSDGIKSKLTGENEEAKSKVEDAMKTFSANMPVAQYIREQQRYYEMQDPNAWLIIERRDIRNGEGNIIKTVPYPVEVSSKEAINYEDKEHKDKWLLMLRERQIEVDGSFIDQEDYYFYTTGYTVLYKEVQEGAEIVKTATSGLFVLTSEGNDNRYFSWRLYKTKSKSFPAMKWGAFRLDSDPDLTSKQPIYWRGRHLLNSIIRGSSFKDVCKYFHLYPKMFAYDEPCSYRDETTGNSCNDGEVNGGECPKCKGSGSDLHRSGIDVVYISIPQTDAREIIPIDKFIHYSRAPLEVAKWIDDDLTKDMNSFFLIILNNQKEEKVVSPVTATEIIYNSENLTSSVKPIADHNSRLNELAYRIAIDYMEAKGLTYNHSFSKKLGLQTSEDLIKKIESAKNVDAGQEVIDAYTSELIAKEYPDQPNIKYNWLAMQRHKPFASYSKDVISLILQDRDNEDRDKLLYNNWDFVKRISLMTAPNFYELSYETQKAIIDGVIGLKKEEIKIKKDPEPSFGGFPR